MTDQIETDQITPQDAEYVLTKQEIAAILFAVDRDDRAGLLDLMGPLHAADIADLLEQLNTFDRRRLIELYGMEFGGDILSELEENLREEVIQLLSPQVLAQAVRDLDSDDVVDLVEDLNAGQKEAILDALGGYGSTGCRGFPDLSGRIGWSFDATRGGACTGILVRWRYNRLHACV